ncbi:AAA family ATPase [Mycolicibacterium neoaurum]|uniref:AAA family ATPase n=1 Tax=Mycolicibacterium neoaurum TaxID=1795 RepID=UPI0032B22EB3
MSDNRVRPRVIDFRPKPPASDKEERPKVWKATQLERAKPKTWLAKQRIPRAGVTVLVGDEGIGKSLFWVWIVAAITTGEALPMFGIPKRSPQHVRLILTEDDWSTEVRPRLEVAKADLRYVDVVACSRDGSGSPVFPSDDMALLYEEPIPAFIVVDAWLDTVHGSLNVQMPQDARKALHPWKDLAVQLDAAVLLMTHTNRDTGSSARNKYGITGELRKKARMTLFAQRDERGQLVIGPEKANGTAIVAASMFTIDSVAVREPTDDDDGTVPRLRYISDSDQDMREHAAGDMAPEAKWLIEFLCEEAKTSAEVFDAAKELGFKRHRIYVASRSLKVKQERTGFQGKTMWSLP